MGPCRPLGNQVIQQIEGNVSETDKEKLREPISIKWSQASLSVWFGSLPAALDRGQNDSVQHPPFLENANQMLLTEL